MMALLALSSYLHNASVITMAMISIHFVFSQLTKVRIHIESTSIGADPSNDSQV